MNATGAAVALPAALLDPATYPHPVDAPVRLVETHVSWVALTGPCAYKVKKPLRLSFLDYSTAERRAHCCAEELRLNRRFAPDLYLDVATITRDGNRLRIGSNRGEVVDHAVRMRDAARRFAHLGFDLADPLSFGRPVAWPAPALMAEAA